MLMEHYILNVLLLILKVKIRFSISSLIWDY